MPGWPYIEWIQIVFHLDLCACVPVPLQTKDETHDGTVVDLSHGVRSVLVDGLIQPVQLSQ